MVQKRVDDIRKIIGSLSNNSDINAIRSTLKVMLPMLSKTYHFMSSLFFILDLLNPILTLTDLYPDPVTEI